MGGAWKQDFSVEIYMFQGITRNKIFLATDPHLHPIGWGLET